MSEDALAAGVRAIDSSSSAAVPAASTAALQQQPVTPAAAHADASSIKTGDREACAGVTSERVGAASAGAFQAPAAAVTPPTSSTSLPTIDSSTAILAASIAVALQQQPVKPAAAHADASFTKRNFKYTIAQVTGDREACAGATGERVGTASASAVQGARGPISKPFLVTLRPFAAAVASWQAATARA